MALTLKQSSAVTALSDLLYDFLPWSGSANWKGHVSFRTVAQKAGVGDFWQAGSKHSGLIALLEQTLNYRRDRFERLMLEIVRAGIVYRQKQNNPIKPQDVDKLNGLILELEFKFPDLWDPEFRNSLSLDADQRAKKHLDDALKEERLKIDIVSERTRQLTELKEQFFTLHNDDDRHQAGYALERILNRLFAVHGLAPREPFRVVGEQIDGSLDLDHETYLVEAKWEKGPLPESALLVFRGKIEGKSAYTRGIFIALNGITKDAQEAITRGKQPNFFVVDGYDLTMVRADHIGLTDFLRQRRRLLAEEGQVVVPFSELWRGSRTH